MLVLTRKPGESIIIDGGIRITVTQVRGENVRIGIEAPPEVRVNRSEIQQRIEEFGPEAEKLPRSRLVSPVCQA